MSRVWAFDPGQTTGYAVMKDTEIIRVGEFTTKPEVILQQIEVIDTVLYEMLHCSPGFNPIGFEIIGVIKYFCRQKNITPIGRQPSLMKGPSLWPSLDDVREKFKSPHIRAAIYHLAAWNLDNYHRLSTLKEDLHED